MKNGDSFNVDVKHSNDYFIIAAKHRPKPSGKDVYPGIKRSEAAQRRDEEREDIDFEAAGQTLRAHFARLRERGCHPDQRPEE